MTVNQSRFFFEYIFQDFTHLTYLSDILAGLRSGCWLCHLHESVIILFVFSTHYLGKIGDWKNTLTEEQDQLFDSVFRSKMKDCALEFVWGE